MRLRFDRVLQSLFQYLAAEIDERAQHVRQYFLSEDDIKLLWQFYSFIMANARISKNVA